MGKVLINHGEWGGRVINGETHELVRGLSVGRDAHKPFITVIGGSGSLPDKPCRVVVTRPEDYVVLDPQDSRFQRGTESKIQTHYPNLAHFLGAASPTPVTAAPKASPEEIRERLIERFSILNSLTTDVARGDIKGLVIWGASGVGKSFEVEAALNRDSLMDKLSFNAQADDQNQRRISRDGEFRPRYNVIKGYSTASALYQDLYEYSDPREVLVFDDCDSVLGDETALNLLKVALDTTRKRVISWRSGTRNGSGAPNSFEFRGGVIFITNVNFEHVIERGTSKIAKHLEAIRSRCLCLDLTIDTTQEKLVRIDHVVRQLGMLTKEFMLEDDQVQDVLDWTHANANRFRELSLRKVGQLATLRKGNPNWQRVAEITLLRRT